MSEYPLGCSLKIPHENRDKFRKKVGKRKRSSVASTNPRARMANARGYLFKPGRVLTVAFKGGDYELHKDIARWAKTWEKYANLKFDFGHDKDKQQFRRWSRRNKQKKADIRISFESTKENSGYWSAIGNDIDWEANGEPFYPANIPTMNFEDLRSRKKSKQRAFVLHEFGHAMGFLHEHQSPSGKCNKEFRWEDEEGYTPTFNKTDGYVRDKDGLSPGIFRVMEGKPYLWTRQQIKDNMLMQKRDYAFPRAKFDSKSIMKYYYEPWMYIKGKKSSCYSDQENTQLSELDKKSAAIAYPFPKKKKKKKRRSRR